MYEFEDVTDPDLSPLEYLINLGVQGNHVLFENERIREAFEKQVKDEMAELDSEVMAEVKEAVNTVLTIPEFEGKKDYISTLPLDVQDVLIYLYFQMVEKTMLLNQTRHH